MKMNNLIRELTLAEQLQQYVLDSEVCHHFKISNGSITLNFRNTPHKETIDLLKKWGFKVIPKHRVRKFVLQSPNNSRKEVE